MTTFRHQPVTAAELRTRLRAGYVRFAFVKLDGSLREVQGTLNLNHIPASHHPSGHGSTSDKSVRFWDLLAAGWRSVRVNGAQIFILE